ncbi:EAL domain-containing protein [Pleionea sediminis]|uniref:EAL domain-containing protein n=1 Tax=Pleionea sediminis TaxID=2569479 RepID=UPI0011871F99|nr:EAL domain-containing protein [Pleionea sediminis]
MKSIVSRIIALWAVLLILCFYFITLANEAYSEKEKQQLSQWLTTQQAIVAQKLKDAEIDDTTNRRHLISEISLIPSVNSAAIISGNDVLTAYEKSPSEQLTFYYRYPLKSQSYKNAFLEVQFLAENLNINFFSWYWFIVLSLLVVGSVIHYWLFQPMFELEKKAEAILTGDYNPEHFYLSDEHPMTSELAINLLLNEHHINRQEQTELSNRLRKHSFVDAITGLGNREYFDAELEIHLRAKDESIHGAVVLFSFEPILELEHEEKQRFSDLLKQIGTYFQRFIDEEDLCYVARRGGVDFSLLILEQAPEKVQRLCNKIIKDLSRSVFDVTEFHHHFTSVGVTFFNTGDDAYDILASADMSLRNAQLEGENKVHIYQPKNLSKAQIKGSVRWRSFLQTILDRRQVILIYQPQISVSDDKSRFEVLARIEEHGKMIAASVFLPMANRCGMASDFDRLIIDTALKELSFSDDLADTELSINLFSDSLLNKKFIIWLTQRLSLVKSICERITFEISEFSVFRLKDQIKEPMQEIASMGCRWCVEHVGSPTANLSYLSELPVSTLKISRTTIRDIVQQSEKQLFVQSIITAANQAGLSVWAEGVEVEEEWNVLMDLGISGGQGYFFGSPQVKLLMSDEFSEEV